MRLNNKHFASPMKNEIYDLPINMLPGVLSMRSTPPDSPSTKLKPSISRLPCLPVLKTIITSCDYNATNTASMSSHSIRKTQAMPKCKERQHFY